MRARVDRKSGLGAWAFKAINGVSVYCPGHRVVSMAAVEDLDSPRQCETVAVTAADRFGLSVYTGFALIGQTVEDAELIQHCWNGDGGGRMIDAALGRRRPLGYLGKRLDERSVARLGRFSALDRGVFARV